MAVGDEGTHAAWLGESERLQVVKGGQFGIETVGMRSDIAEQVLGMSRVPRLLRRIFDRAFTQDPCFFESTEK